MGVKVMKRENSGGTCYRSKKKNSESNGLEDTSECEYESVTFEYEDKGRKENRMREERENRLRSEKLRARRTRDEREDALRSENLSARRAREEKEDASRSENLRTQRKGSSCSSYYSVSSGEFESDNEVRVKRDGYRGESSSEYKRELKRNGDVVYDGEVAEEVEKHDDYAEEKELVSNNKNSGEGCDWRKKTEKRLAEVSFEQKVSRKESSQKHFMSSEVHESGKGKQSNFHKLHDDREEKSTWIDEEAMRRYNEKGDRTTGQSESMAKYKQLKDAQEVHSSASGTTTTYQEKKSGRGGFVREATGKLVNPCEPSSRHDENARNSNQAARVSETQQTECRSDDTEDLNPLAGRWASTKMNLRGKSQQLTETLDANDIDNESIFISHRESDTTMKKQEQNSDLAFYSHPEAKEKNSEMDSETIRRIGSRKESQRVSEKATSSQSYSTSVVKLDEGIKERLDLTDEMMLQIRSKKKDERPIKLSSFDKCMPADSSSWQISLVSNSQSGVEQIGVNEGDNRSPEAIVRPPPSQPVARGRYGETTGGFVANVLSDENLGSGSSILHEHVEETSSTSQHDIYGESRLDETLGEPLIYSSHEDVLGSANRFQKSSMHFVGEFVQKMSHEVSTSEVQKNKKTYETKTVYTNEQHKQKNMAHDSSAGSQPKAGSSWHSSRGSGTKGPSDEMWDTADPSIKEPLEKEVPEATTTTENAVVKRTGRSMWGVIADIVHMRWASRSETHSKSGRRSSPNQSTSSGTWFSGLEPDENTDETTKKERRRLPQEPSLDQQQAGGVRAQSQREASTSVSLKDKVKDVRAGSQSSSSIEISIASEDILSSSTEETRAEHLESTSRAAIVTSSIELPALRMRRSPVTEEVSGAGKADASSSGTMVQLEQPVSHLEASGTEGKSGALKRGKLQRNNQVLKDRFDEWEETFVLETEQRKNDEIFMKEALLEAKKAADMWEVPVGAVLVHHGKVIARGYNLVEELRDSTAHAEMICIRDASNILQTWRLSGTTLYVTLEPCPMCAGAILQARVDTVVWGAPNKLLGADGSWIRLFPDGGVKNGLESPDKPAAPVHPFHPKITIRRGILASECADVMQQFFQLRRRKKEKTPEPPTPPSCLPISTHPSKFLTKMHDAFNIMFCL
ncbi:hypothetical protein RJ639_045854 [Escallonia herrerae]|uniref:tRNA(adenine(34)) deaminase n=1 Tax=Escallonia herrerae TaxID=1293975 RepID=A0AA88W6C1_9ASTE|nr:hypothetical protein RJ639_045854 [Escallonia herrerae]